MKTFIALIICIINLVIVNAYAGYNEDMAAINKGMPNQVQHFNKRQIECNHWSGEEPYNKARALEITAAVKRLKCDALDKDEKNLIEKYKSNSGVVKSINKAKEFF